MDLETVPKFYEEIQKIRNSMGMDCSDVVKTVYLYKDKYGTGCKEMLDVMGRDLEKLENRLS